MISPCACMRPVNGDPYCPCEMEARGIAPTTVWDEKTIDKFKTAVSRWMAANRKEKNDSIN